MFHIYFGLRSKGTRRGAISHDYIFSARNILAIENKSILQIVFSRQGDN
jgi:hypothetical protein